MELYLFIMKITWQTSLGIYCVSGFGIQGRIRHHSRYSEFPVKSKRAVIVVSDGQTG